jgi:hypothetical protein
MHKRYLHVLQAAAIGLQQEGHSILKSYGKNFERIVDFGSLFGLKFIIRPISEYLHLPLFVFLHNFIPNYGFVIIVFSLIIKIALHPLTRSSMKSMKKMQLLQPKIAEIKEKFKDDPQKVNKETMRLYSTYGINPAGGANLVIGEAGRDTLEVTRESQIRQHQHAFGSDRDETVNMNLGPGDPGAQYPQPEDGCEEVKKGDRRKGCRERTCALRETRPGTKHEVRARHQESGSRHRHRQL